MRRSRIDIICSFLSALEHGPMKPTPLMHKTNLPHELFMKYVRELEAASLIRQVRSNKSTQYLITEEGALYLKEYHRFLKFSAGFGL